MKTQFKYPSIYLLALMLWGCADSLTSITTEIDSQLIPISLSATYPTATRASDAGFDNGDRMGVFVLDYIDDSAQDINSTDTHAYNKGFEFDETNSKWESVTSLYWTSNDTPADIIGYYPYSETLTNPREFPFTIARRQDKLGSENEIGGYEASDFLWAKAEKVMPTDSRVDLTFKHIMAGVRITLKEGSGFGSGEWSSFDKAVLVSNIKPYTNIDLSTGNLSDASGDEISVSAYNYGEDWRAIVVPQNIEAGKNVIDISIDGISYHLTKESATEYLSGKLTSFTITVNKRSENGEYEFVITDESIISWIDDADFHEGIVRNYIVIDVPNKGTLKSIISQMNISESTITGLKLTGEINAVDFAFMRDNCSALKSLNLKEVTVWSGSKQNMIPAKAMYNKSTLSHIVFPDNLDIIGDDAFFRTGLTGSLIIPEGVTRIGVNASAENDAGWTGIVNSDNGVFAYCDNLVGELSLPSTLEYIADRAFSQTNFSGYLNLPESLKSIGNLAFEYNNFEGDLIIPNSVEFIGAGAFANNTFTGRLKIPESISVIRASAFAECGFEGNLTLPEGIVEIRNNAFKQCKFKGELKLPESLKYIDDYAFALTDISNISFPTNLATLGQGAFLGCRYLRGSISIPESIIRINDLLFAGCTMITEIILPENITSIGGAALYGCSILNSIVCNTVEPPLLRQLDKDVYYYDSFDSSYGFEVSSGANSFDGINKSNIVLTVPKESVSDYKSSSGWSEFNRITEYSNFLCTPATVCALNNAHSETLTLNSDGEWEIIEKPEWCSLSKTSGNLKSEITLTVNALSRGSGNRNDKIVFRLKDTDITTECEVSQYDYEYGEDECLTLQKSTIGNGIDVVFLGDGWDAESIANGEYLNLVKEQMEDFFGIEPYTTYRDRFNVYACISLSQETGINSTSTWRNTRFMTFYAHDCDGNGYLGHDDIDEVIEYAVSHSPLKRDNIAQSLIIMTLNSDEYGSSTTITEKGTTISICSPSIDTYPMDTRGIIQHEACGHGFGKLAEERIIENKYISEAEKSIIAEYQWRGWYQNISLSGKHSDVPWSEIIFDQRYSDNVDIYEGAYGKRRGVYRAENNSCMNYGIPYFSAAARMDIMKRILEYSGEGFTMEKFYATDSDKWGSTSTTRAAMPSNENAYINSGLHHPVRIIKSKKY